MRSDGRPPPPISVGPHASPRHPRMLPIELGPVNATIPALTAGEVLAEQLPHLAAHVDAPGHMENNMTGSPCLVTPILSSYSITFCVPQSPPNASKRYTAEYDDYQAYSQFYNLWLVVSTPLIVGMIIPNIGKQHVPNHQPDLGATKNLIAIGIPH